MPMHFKTPSLRGAKPYVLPHIPLLPQLSLSLNYEGLIPSRDLCYELLDKYHSFPHIIQHSEVVADMAVALANKALTLYPQLPTSFIDLTLSASLLHDIAKSYTVQHGGSHAQIGASWVIAETKNARLGQAIFHHVEWAWALPQGMSLLNPTFLVLYADKRARHAEIVTLEERYEDLLIRYGKSPAAIDSIKRGHAHVNSLQTNLNQLLEIDLNEYTLDNGRLVCRG